MRHGDFAIVALAAVSAMRRRHPPRRRRRGRPAAADATGRARTAATLDAALNDFAWELDAQDDHTPARPTAATWCASSAAHVIAQSNGDLA